MTKPYYAPKPNKARDYHQADTTPPPDKWPTTSKHPMIPNSCNLVRFVLKSGAALELDTATIDEVTDSIAGRHCHAICGCTAEGKKVAVEWSNVDYIVEA